MIPTVTTTTTKPRRTVAKRPAASIRTRGAAPPSAPALNRRALRSELLALYGQYEADIRCANRIEAEHLHLAGEADDARRDARRRMNLIAQLLDSEYPGWDAELARTPRAEP
jgi:hypothetical protein